MLLRYWVVATLCVLPLRAFGSDQTFTFKSHGKEVKKLSLDSLQKVVSPEKVRVDDPSAKEQVTYEALQFQKILNSVYGDAWKRAEELLFTCADGYQPSIPSRVFQDYDAFLALKKESGDFSIINRHHGGERVELGPFYMVWNNLKQPKVKNEGVSIWPYQIVSVDLVSFAERFPNMAPPSASSRSAKRGFLAFRKQCMPCHSMNGEGGARGVELNYPVNVTQYFKMDWLKRWIDDPRAIRFNTTMPAFISDGGNRNDQIADVIAYLKSMEKKKVAPKAAGGSH
ncbi:MAG: c-type cytochrome [Bdellovibrionota bacterium]